MTDSDAAAVDAFPELEALITIRAAGWLFLPVRRDADGEPVEVNGFRQWPDGTLDVIKVRNSTDALVRRCPPGEPLRIVWERTGTLTDVVAEVLALPAPGDRSAPRLVIGHAPQIWTP